MLERVRLDSIWTSIVIITILDVYIHSRAFTVLPYLIFVCVWARSWELILRRVVPRHLSCILLRLQMVTIVAGRFKEGNAGYN